MSDDVRRLVEASVREFVSEAQDKISKETAKTQTRTSLISGGLVLLGVLASSGFSFFTEDEGHSIEKTKIALALLSGDNAENALPARRFAVLLLLAETGVALSEEDRELWVRSGTIPALDFKSFGASTHFGTDPFMWAEAFEKAKKFEVPPKIVDEEQSP
ncbi:hypothetical protein [Sedimentitalea todarodis]|uniref:Uncharacterized protein n=1 Tax=Sedimentitalea todarodis TaxID=1631240 RepID=A0ABU3VFK4_9RHOB|nr:hypothetical protein [Sedimentitalea todarodis]MDU9004967.1 hypothetical protein [Sedimentitalea todarodis]